MFKKFYPYEHIDSVFSIDYSKLYDMGYRGVIFDLDNTLVHHGDDSNPSVDNLFKYIHSVGLKTLILTNNDHSRVKRFIKNIDTMYICDANKPNKSGYLSALKRLRLKKNKVVYIGDQIFIDIVGANGCGIPSVLVDFIRIPGVTKIGKKRYLEKFILFFYRRSKYYNRLNIRGDMNGKKVIL